MLPIEVCGKEHIIESDHFGQKHQEITDKQYSRCAMQDSFQELKWHCHDGFPACF